MSAHIMGPSRLNHGLSQCTKCHATDREIAFALGPVCRVEDTPATPTCNATLQVPAEPSGEVRERAAAIVDPDAWHAALPKDGCGTYWMGRRYNARQKADAILSLLAPAINGREVEAETYRQMHDTARELGYPDLLAALEALGSDTSLAEAAVERCARVADAYRANADKVSQERNGAVENIDLSISASLIAENIATAIRKLALTPSEGGVK